MSKKILTFTEFGEINEASLTQPTLIQKALAQAAEVKGSPSTDQAKAGEKGKLGKILIRDLFFATKLGGDLLAAVDSDPDLKAAWTKAKIIPNDSPATVEEIESEISSNPEKKKAAEENIKNLNAAGKKTQKPDYKLLPQSSDYVFDDVKDVTWDGLKGILDSEGLSKQINFNQYNLVGIRNKISTKKKFLNRFTDVVFLMSPQKEKKIKYFPATTVPGPFYLVNPFRNYYVATGSKDAVNPKGLAIVQPGVYEFKIGKHRGQYEALLQSGQVKVQRYQPIDDPAKVTFDTYSPGKEEKGQIGINIHRGLRSGETPTIDSHSAGCIVLKNASDLRAILGDMKSNNQQNINFALVQIDDIPAKVLATASSKSEKEKLKDKKTA
jgi:hypothetical protein